MEAIAPEKRDRRLGGEAGGHIYEDGGDRITLLYIQTHPDPKMFHPISKFDGDHLIDELPLLCIMHK